MDPRLLKEERARRALYAERERRRVDADRYNWKKHARAEQLPPPWKWRTWLILAGRGWGKTRSGAEWVRANYKTNQFINLIGATADDARDIMIEGETGVLAICPPDERPIYMPSKRRLEWPNGSISLIFTADEPERLRGKQHMRLWCFVQGTQVLTGDNNAAGIETIAVGDEVMTRSGPMRVTAIGNRLAEVGTVKIGHSAALTGTAEHPVLTSDGWIPLAKLSIGSSVVAVTSAPTSASAGSAASARTSTSTGGFGCRLTARFQRALTFITKTITRSTTTSPTLSFSGTATTLGTTIKAPFASLARLSLSSSPNATCVDATSFGGKWAASRNARGVPKKSPTPSEASPGAHAVTAELRFNRGVETSVVKVASTWVPAGVQRVYNLTVEKVHEYVANGVIVHNCDELCSWKYPEAWDQAMLGLRIGSNPQVVVTTTPRPTKLIKELASNASTHVTQGTTYANRANLAPAFFDEIIKKYEGTRLGRQELDAEILTDNPAALWQRDKIDQTRVQKAPDMSRIVVAIDPAVTSTETSDLTGIVVAGLAGDHAYILADASISATPDAWARKALNAYHDANADLIVAETNNGGDLVETVLRTVDRSVPYKKVHASRGKQIRAEPIAALYEQGRVHHVGSFPELEDQMCEFDPTASQKSPDRMDALVWALSELTQGPSRKGIVTELRL